MNREIRPRLQVQEIPISEIQVSEFNTRKDLKAGTEDSSISDLAQSIQENGLLNPVTVRPASVGWELVAGQRRFQACRQLGWETIPAFIRAQMQDVEATGLSLIENVQRADMHPLDKAHALLRLVEAKESVAAVAKATGISQPTIRKYLDLTKLPTDLQGELSTSQGPIGIEALSTLAREFQDEDEAMSVFEQIRGFNRDVQKEILKQSEGDIGRVGTLAEQAREGLFEVKTCRDGFCFLMDESTKRAFRMAAVGDRLSVRKLIDGLSL